MRAAAALLSLALLGAARAEGADAVKRADTVFQDVTVKPGDTLWSIAHKYLKDPSRWDAILKYNRLPTADPTVALPGLTLRVPITLIKVSQRAAHLVYAVNRVLSRPKETADWKPAKREMELFQGDFLRTLEASKARVLFLNKELLNLEPNSMAVIKPADHDADVELRSGSIFAGHARVATASARVTPRTRDTRYSASVEADLTTKVEVYKGLAAVEAQGSSVDVPAGMETRVAPGLAPERPQPLANAPQLEARAQEFASAETVGGGAAPHPRVAEAAPEPEADADSLRGDIDSMRIGLPILGYHVQAARDRDFKDAVFDRKYDTDERYTASDAKLAPGAYWWRIAVVDLLGVEGRFSEPRYYTVGVKRVEKPVGQDLGRLLSLTSPAEEAIVDADTVRVYGVLRDDRLRLEIAGKPVRIDADGNFVATVTLQAGRNQILLVVTDGKGNETRISRRVTRR